MRNLVLGTIVVITLGTLSSGPRLAASGAQQSPAVSAISAEALEQINALVEEKKSRTPAQRKMASQLVYAVKMARGELIAAGVARLDVRISTVGTDSNRSRLMSVPTSPISC